MCRTHDPSGFRRRRPRLRRHPQQQRGDTRGLRRQCQLAAGDEIELARMAPDLEHDGADRIAGQSVGRGPQRSVGILGAHGDQQPRIETEFAEPAHRQRAGFNFRKVLPHPDQRPPRRHPSREPRDEAGSRRALVSFCEHFMHRRARQPALQHSIRSHMAERDLVEVMRRALLQAFDASAQTRKRARACAAHAPLLRKIGLAASSLVNPRLAHLFMICSNIKLTGRAESIEIDAPPILWRFMSGIKGIQ